MAAISANCVVNINNIQFSENFGPTFGPAQPISLLPVGINQTLAVGSGANQFQKCYAATKTIVSGSPLVLNLTDGISLTNPDGTFAVFSDIVLFYVKNGGTAGQIITIGGGTNEVTSIWTPGSTSLENVRPLGGICLKTAFGEASGFAVTASTACTIQLVNASGTDAAVDILILGHG